jgi:hypothetical protein
LKELVIIIDEMFDRAYHQGRAELNAGLASAVRRFGASMTKAFEVLNRIDYDAPWLHQRRKGRHA